jgi:hypothetical protein
MQAEQKTCNISLIWKLLCIWGSPLFLCGKLIAASRCPRPTRGMSTWRSKIRRRRRAHYFFRIYLARNARIRSVAVDNMSALMYGWTLRLFLSCRALGAIGMGMKSKLRFLGPLLIPLLASCSSFTGVAKKDPVPCPPGPSKLAAFSQDARSSKSKKLPLAVELCSFPRDGNSECKPSARRSDKVAACRMNPLVPDLKFPLPEGTLSSGFGFRRGVFHAGLDITACKGHPILASADGTVVATGSRKGYRSYGQTVLIDHGRNVFTHYAHASRILVRPGQKVRKGQKIALVGATGRATSPHLHFEVRVGSQLLNPYPYFGPAQLRGIQVAKNFFGRPMGPVGARRRYLTLSSSHR